MTVLQLIFTLIRGVLTGRFRPGDLVAREHGPWDKDGRDNVKAIYFTERRPLKEHVSELDRVVEEDGGLTHRRFGHYGTGGEYHVVVLD